MKPLDAPDPAPDPRPAIRRRRAGLPREVVLAASRRVACRVWRHPVLARAGAIACYIAVGGEIDCRCIIREAWRRGRHVLLPVLSRTRLYFAPYAPDTSFMTNAYGIPEPVCHPAELVRPQDLDVVLTPLVAFDARGYRLGMGAGYYDRSFGFLLARRHWNRPRLIGLAHDFQYRERVPIHAHDVPLSSVITESTCHRFDFSRGTNTCWTNGAP